jgi:hypothetical protein
MVNGWARSNAQGDKLAIAGSFVVLVLDDDAITTIEANAKLNQDVDWRTAKTNATPNGNDHAAVADQGQLVSVYALNAHQVVTMAGQLGTKLGLIAANPIGNEGGKGAFGGSADAVTVITKTQAIIKPGASVYSGQTAGITVTANDSTFVLALGHAGGKAGKAAVNGSITIVVHLADTLAHVDSGVTLRGGYARIAATSLSTLINAAGGVSTGAGTGVGVSLAVTWADRDTRAVLGALDTASASTVNVNVPASSPCWPATTARSTPSASRARRSRRRRRASRSPTTRSTASRCPSSSATPRRRTTSRRPRRASASPAPSS